MLYQIHTPVLDTEAVGENEPVNPPASSKLGFTKYVEVDDIGFGSSAKKFPIFITSTDDDLTVIEAVGALCNMRPLDDRLNVLV